MSWMFRILHGDHRLGLRIVKTGVAVTVCAAVSRLIYAGQPFLAVVAAVLSMGKSVDSTVKAGRNRLIGVVIGSLVGGAFAMISPANAGLCGIGAILVLYLCHILRLDGAGPLACVTFAAILFGSPSAASSWPCALSCAQGALIGIAVAIVVNLALMPPNYSEEIQRSDRELQNRITAAMQNAKGRGPIDIRGMEDCMERLSGAVRQYVSESRLFRWNDEAVFQISRRITGYRSFLDELKVIKVMNLDSQQEPGGELGTVYRYHISRMKELYLSIQAPETASEPEKKKKNKS